MMSDAPERVWIQEGQQGVHGVRYARDRRWYETPVEDGMGPYVLEADIAALPEGLIERIKKECSYFINIPTHIPKDPNVPCETCRLLSDILSTIGGDK